MGSGEGPEPVTEALVVLLAVDAGLPLAQQVQVGSVDDEEFHGATSSKKMVAARAAAASGVGSAMK